MTYTQPIPNLSLRYFIALVVVPLPLFSLGPANHGLWTADEPRAAEIGREMAEAGNRAVPMLNRKPFLEHPTPLLCLFGHNVRGHRRCH